MREKNIHLEDLTKEKIKEMTEKMTEEECLKMSVTTHDIYSIVVLYKKGEIMEPAWLKWLKDNMPKDLFEDFQSDRSWSESWKEDRIRLLEIENEELQSKLNVT